jgi:hypothetical protein
VNVPNIIRLTQFIGPWFSVVFLPKKSIDKFIPVSLFASVLVGGMCSLAIPFKWWRVEGGLKEKILNDSSFIFGPFLVGTLWIFHFTFGNFKRYFLVNLIMDFLFSYPLNYLYQKLRLYRLVNFKPKYILGFFMSYALIIYGFQLLVERSKKYF